MTPKEKENYLKLKGEVAILRFLLRRVVRDLMRNPAAPRNYVVRITEAVRARHHKRASIASVSVSVLEHVDRVLDDLQREFADKPDTR